MIDWVGSTKPGGVFERLPGNRGAPAVVGDTVTERSAGDPFNWSAFSYAERIGWSYMMPVLARTTVRSPTLQARPTRGPKLFLSTLNFWEYENGESARA